MREQVPAQHIAVSPALVPVHHMTAGPEQVRNTSSHPPLQPEGLVPVLKNRALPEVRKKWLLAR